MTYIADDVPVSFDPRDRQYGFRPVHETFITKNIMPGVITRHDPVYDLPAADDDTAVFMTRMQLNLDKQATVEALKNLNRMHGAIACPVGYFNRVRLHKAESQNHEGVGFQGGTDSQDGADKKDIGDI